MRIAKHDSGTEVITLPGERISSLWPWIIRLSANTMWNVAAKHIVRTSELD
jgi:hypothetical protein